MQASEFYKQKVKNIKAVKYIFMETHQNVDYYYTIIDIGHADAYNKLYAIEMEMHEKYENNAFHFTNVLDFPGNEIIDKSLGTNLIYKRKEKICSGKKKSANMLISMVSLFQNMFG